MGYRKNSEQPAPALKAGDKIALTYELAEYNETPEDAGEDYQPDMRPVFAVVPPAVATCFAVVEKVGAELVHLTVDVVTGTREVPAYGPDPEHPEFMVQVGTEMVDKVETRRFALPIATAMVGHVPAEAVETKASTPVQGIGSSGSGAEGAEVKKEEEER